METNALAIWWYWWGRSKREMDLVDSGGAAQMAVDFRAEADGDEDDGDGVHVQATLRYLPMTALPCANGAAPPLHACDDDDDDEAGVEECEGDGSDGGEGRAKDDDPDGPYGSRYQAWRGRLSEDSRRLVDRESSRARHCSALLHRVDRRLWHIIDEALSESVADCIEVGMREGRIEARTLDRLYAGTLHARELNFRRAGEAPASPTPGGGDGGYEVPARLTPKECAAIILNNRKQYTPASLRKATVGPAPPLVITKASGGRRRAARYRGARRFFIETPAAARPRSNDTPAGGEADLPPGTACPLQIWPPAAYVRDTNIYL